jgi:hypothetical protein
LDVANVLRVSIFRLRRELVVDFKPGRFVDSVDVEVTVEVIMVWRGCSFNHTLLKDKRNVNGFIGIMPFVAAAMDVPVPGAYKKPAYRHSRTAQNSLQRYLFATRTYIGTFCILPETTSTLAIRSFEVKCAV